MTKPFYSRILLLTYIMWRWFIKRKKESNQNLSNDPKWASLAASLKTSFKLVKDDINHLSTHNSEQDKKIEELSKQIQKIETRMDNMFMSVSLHSQAAKPKEIEIPSPQEQVELTPRNIAKLLENLTDVQRSILMTLLQVTKELPSGWISLKELAAEIYPNKKYSDVRTMMSEYTDKLVEFGLINKRRKGREVVIALTNKTKDINLNNKEIIQKKEQKRSEQK